MTIDILPFEQLPDAALLRWRDIELYRLVPFKRSEAHARAHEGRFPRFEKVGARASAVRVRDLREWLQDPTGWRAAGSTEAKPRRCQAAE